MATPTVESEHYTPRLQRVREFCSRNRARGLWPTKESAVYHMWQHLKYLAPGYQKAFIKIGGKLFIDERAFFEEIQRVRLEAETGYD